MAVPAGDLTLMRSHPQFQKFFLAVEKPPTVWVGRVNDATISRGEIDIVFDNAVLTRDLYIYFTLWVSDAITGGHGNYDKGVTRLRYNLTDLGAAGTIKVASNDIQWADNDYLTVKEEMRPWAVLPNLDNTEEDEDHAYVDQNTNLHPLARIGPPACVFLEDGSVTVNFWSDDVAIAAGASPTTWNWTFRDGSPLTANTAGTADVPIEVTYSSCGQKWLWHTVTDGTKAHTRHSMVFVFDMETCPPITAFSVESLRGDLNSGGWSGSIRVWQDADVEDFPEMARVVLFNQAYWEGVQDDVGYGWEHRENISFVGYIVKDSVYKDPETGSVVFEVCSIVDIMKELTCWPANLADESPATWHHIPDMTLNLAAFHVFTEHTNIDHIADIYLNLDDIAIDYIDISEGDPYDQIKTQIGEAGRAILANNKYGQIYLEPNAQLRKTADRATIDTMFALGHGDWKDEITLDAESDTKETCQVDFIGFTEGLTPFGSLAPGRQWSTGGVKSVKGVRVSDQADANTYAGLFERWYNGDFKNVGVPLAGFWPVLDIAPQRYIELTLAEADTNRGLVWSELKHIPKQVSYSINAEGGYCTVDLTLEQETFGVAGVDNPLTPPEYPDPPDPPDPWEPTLPEVDGEELFSTGPLAGLWFSDTRGYEWADCSGGDGGGDGTDVKISPTTVGNPRATQQVWWVVNNGLRYSPDGGQSWSTKTVCAHNVWAVCPSRTDADTLYALVANSANNQVWLYKSVDRAENWTSIEITLYGTYSVDTDGHTNHIDINADDTYVFVAVYRGASTVCVKIPADLSTHTPGPGRTGYWGGVRCDPSDPDTIWNFGDFYSGEIYKSTNLAASWVNVSPAWSQLVSVLMISVSDPDDVVAYDRTNQDIYITRDGASSWTRDEDALPFTTYSGARGKNDASLLFTGRDATNAIHLQSSIDTGAGWLEASGGIVPSDAEIASIAISLDYV